MESLLLMEINKTVKFDDCDVIVQVSLVEIGVNQNRMDIFLDVRIEF